MTSRKPATPPAAPAPDEHAGHGGSYTLDPKTGQRTLIQRTREDAAQPQKEQNDADT